MTASVNKNIRDPLHRERGRGTERRCLAKVFCAECERGLATWVGWGKRL